jgi:soluble lytic murein transglycosylase
MNQCLRSLACVLTFVSLVLVSTEATAKASHKSSTPKKTHEAKAGKQRSAAAGKHRHGKHAEAKRKSKKSDDEASEKPSTPPLTGDVAVLKDAVDVCPHGHNDHAPPARKW